MRTRIPVVVLLITLVSTLLAVPSTAAVDAGAESEVVALVNAERRAAGLAPLTVAGDLTATARTHAGRMADADDLHHNPNLGSDVTGWQKVGENVGRGPQVGAIHEAFMASPSHRANILDPEFTQIGVGVEVRDGRLWITQVFRLPQAAAPAPAPEAAEPTPETAVAAAEVAAPAPSAPAPAPEAAPPPQAEAEPAGAPHTTMLLARVEADEQAVPVDSLLD